MEERRVELLAPAGNYESFLGAVRAGADAVYLGGEKFSARAYADNFSGEEICRAISYAHVFGRKVYLTVNTLIKDAELVELVPYLEPFYLAGLDGVIIQDMGALSVIREAFPGLALHASTQMTVTGSYGARLLKELGAVRIVPARELSLEEIRTMREETGLEMEVFIHGAMCYCYSGQCLFSSILGGRSGNRGRCAQPCRLPYRTVRDKKTGREQYPLSLKDMCTISLLPELIGAGIESFKIEGRMKKPEYAAGVTAIYRKYIDLYYEKGASGCQVSREDMEMLSSLYIRSGLQDGYYFKQNGADMVTLDSPAYSGSDEGALAAVRKKYIEEPARKRIRMEAVFRVGEEARLTISAPVRDGETDAFADNAENILTVSVSGERVMPALKQPLTRLNMIRGLEKLGGTPFYAESDQISVDMDEGCFYPLKAINELRRAGIHALERAFCPYERQPADARESLAEPVSVDREEAAPDGASAEGEQWGSSFRVLVSTAEQLNAVLRSGVRPDMIYLESDMLRLSEDTWRRYRRETQDALPETAVCVALPHILRKKDMPDMERLFPILGEADGCLVRNLEAYGWLKEQGYQGKILTDAGLYCFNRKSLAFWRERADGCCLPYELNGRELGHLLRDEDSRKAERIVYGRIPMMVTANCISRTEGKCLHDDFGRNILYLKDRFQKQFPVYLYCRNCYNIIYNAVVLSLHDRIREGKAAGAMRLCFTVETGAETEAVMRFFADAAGGIFAKPPYGEYTLGHDRRGVE